MNTITYSQTLVVENCYRCGIPFGMPDDFQTVKLRDHDSFYCPNGHPQHYVGKSDATKLLEVGRQLQATRELLHAEERSHVATRGHVTRKRKQLEKVTAGVCPVDGCRRHFRDLERHIATKHPGVVT